MPPNGSPIGLLLALTYQENYTPADIEVGEPTVLRMKRSNESLLTMRESTPLRMKRDHVE